MSWTQAEGLDFQVPLTGFLVSDLSWIQLAGLKWILSPETSHRVSGFCFGLIWTLDSGLLSWIPTVGFDPGDSGPDVLEAAKRGSRFQSTERQTGFNDLDQRTSEPKSESEKLKPANFRII